MAVVIECKIEKLLEKNWPSYDKLEGVQDSSGHGVLSLRLGCTKGIEMRIRNNLCLGQLDAGFLIGDEIDMDQIDLDYNDLDQIDLDQIDLD